VIGSDDVAVRAPGNPAHPESTPLASQLNMQLVSDRPRVPSQVQRSSVCCHFSMSGQLLSSSMAPPRTQVVLSAYEASTGSAARDKAPKLAASLSARRTAQLTRGASNAHRSAAVILHPQKYRRGWEGGPVATTPAVLARSVNQETRFAPASTSVRWTG